MPLLLLGGLFLCFEGSEKVIEKLFHPAPEKDPEEVMAELNKVNIEEYEQSKIKGARNNFV